MPIPLEEARTTGLPVLKRRTIGEKFIGGIVKFETRDLIKDNEVQMKDNGKPRQELVVHLLTSTSTMAAGIGDEETTPGEGDIVRVILKGGGFGQWIDAKKTLGRGVQVGDMLMINSTHAIRYSGTNFKELGTLSTQGEVDEWRQSPANLRRTESLGFRGDLAIRAPKDDEAAFVAACEQAYHTLGRQPIGLEEGAPATGGGGGAPSDLW